jgi:Transposase DDE domain group 1
VAKVEGHPGELYPRLSFIVTNMARPPENVVAFYNKCGSCEQWIKEGKGSIRWTRLSCHSFTPEPIKDWSLTSLKEKLIKIGASAPASTSAPTTIRSPPTSAISIRPAAAGGVGPGGDVGVRADSSATFTGKNTIASTGVCETPACRRQVNSRFAFTT